LETDRGQSMINKRRPPRALAAATAPKILRDAGNLWYQVESRDGSPSWRRFLHIQGLTFIQRMDKAAHAVARGKRALEIPVLPLKSTETT